MNVRSFIVYASQKGRKDINIIFFTRSLFGCCFARETFAHVRQRLRRQQHSPHSKRKKIRITEKTCSQAISSLIEIWANRMRETIINSWSLHEYDERWIDSFCFVSVSFFLPILPCVCVCLFRAQTHSHTASQHFTHNNIFVDGTKNACMRKVYLVRNKKNDKSYTE